MKVKGSGRRVLRFAVSGALLGGAAAGCDKDSNPPDNVNVRQVPEPKPEPKPDNVNVRKEPEPDTKVPNINVAKEPDPDDPPLKVNPGPDEGGGDAGDGTPAPLVEDNVNVRQFEEPPRVNTIKVEDPPEPSPKAEPEKHVNTAPVKEPTVLDEPKKPAGKIKTNTGRVPDDK